MFGWLALETSHSLSKVESSECEMECVLAVHHSAFDQKQYVWVGARSSKSKDCSFRRRCLAIINGYWLVDGKGPL